MSWKSPSRASTACLASRFSVEFVLSKLDKNWFRESMSSSGFNRFNSSRSRKSFENTCLNGRIFLVIAWILWCCEPITFIDFLCFGCFQKVVHIVSSIIMVIVQKVPHWGRVNKFQVFCLFKCQYLEISYIHSFFECIWMIKKKADLDHIFVVLCCQKSWTDKKFFISLWKWRSLNYADRFFICAKFLFGPKCGTFTGLQCSFYSVWYGFKYIWVCAISIFQLHWKEGKT